MALPHITQPFPDYKDVMEPQRLVDRMSEPRSYLDHNATSPIRPAVKAAWLAALDLGNPSSVHAEGRCARGAIEKARARVAALVGAEPDGVIFTSGGTEANAIALRPAALRCPDGRPATRLLAGAGEHASVLGGHRFPAGAFAPVRVDRDGRFDLHDLARQLHGDHPTLVSVGLANSETGVLQPLREIVALARSRGAAVHGDAVQAAGRVPVTMSDLALDALTLSAHKLGGPKGAGALVVVPGRAGPELPLLRGGSQEAGLRAGTENVPGLAGFGLAAELAGREAAGEANRLRALRDRAEHGLRRLASDLVVFGGGAERLPNTLAFAVPGLKAETALIALDLAGVAVSSGSACSSGRVGRSHVLAAMGVSEGLAAGAIRVSLGWSTVPADVDRLLAACETLLLRLYEGGRARAA